MCLHAESVKSCAVCGFDVVDQLYDTFAFCIIGLTEIVVIEFHIFRCIFVCIFECINNEFIAFIYMPPAGVVSMADLA